MAVLNIISNTSPLINLSKIGRLDLLLSLYQDIAIPTAVYQEIVIEGNGRPGSTEIQLLCDQKRIKVKHIADNNICKALMRDIDRGEAEVITLALEIKHDLILLDESDARRVAKLFDLNCIGFIGVLLKAHKIGLIDNFKNTLDEAIEKGFRINPHLYQQLINQ